MFEEILDADVEHAALAPQLQQLRAGHVPGNIRTRQAVDLKIAIVAEHDLPLRIAHHDAMVEIVQGAELMNAFLRNCARLTLRSAEWIQSATAARKEQRTHAADQQFPNHVGIGGADIAGRRKICPAARRADSGGIRVASRHKRACAGIEIFAACLPILVSHQSPAHFGLECLACRGLDRVNAYPCNPVM